MNEAQLKAEVLKTALATIAGGLNRGSAGNVSVRDKDGFIVTPTGMTYEQAVPDDMVFVGLDGTPHGRRKPSSEWRFHRDIYAQCPDAGAVIHCHSPFATSLACLGVEIPSFHYMIARFGGATVRCASYGTFGSQELSNAIVAALRERCACLMANHGMVVYGHDLEHALALTVEFETLCEQYWRALQIGQPRLLPDEEMERILQKFAGYGQQ